jgi:DNA-binding CsgD family transcriptional regulator
MGGIIQARVSLTERQAEVVEWMIRGLLVKEIAERMKISERTVKAFRVQAMERMNARTSGHLVAKYIYEKLGIEFARMRESRI